MPVITIERERLSKFLGRTVSTKFLEENLPWLGLDINEVGSDYVKVEFNPNRIDFSSHVGIARALKGIMELEIGLPEYDVKQGDYIIKVDESVTKVRPYIAGAIIRNIKLSNEDLKEIVEIQEDIHWGVGRNRRKLAIGIHDLDKVKGPFTYTTGHPSTKFVPLNAKEEMSLREILEKHEKGIAFRHLLSGAEQYPLIVDSEGRIMSFPPIINSQLTKLDEHTRNLFIDVTGIDLVAISKGLNILVTALHDMGGEIETVKVVYNDKELIYPDLKPEKMLLKTDSFRNLSGLNLADEEIVKCLEKSRLGAKLIKSGLIEVLIPSYRTDIMQEVDLIEEALIGYGFYKLTPTIPSTSLTGRPHRLSKLKEITRNIMIGMGFIEVMNFSLTSIDLHYTKMRMKVGRPVTIMNPVSSEYSIIRESLIPGLMKNLSENKHETYPQKIFEISDVVKLDRRLDVMSKRSLHIAGAISHSKATFTEGASYVNALLVNLGVKEVKMKEVRHPSFINGRVAKVYADNIKVGILGEIHPEVLKSFELENPVVAFEIDLEKIWS